VCRARCFGLPLFSVNACEALTRKVGASADKEAASVGGLFHFKPDARCRLLALNVNSLRRTILVANGAKRANTNVGLDRLGSE
jgi:hypothetical protein